MEKEIYEAMVGQEYEADGENSLTVGEVVIEDIYEFLEENAEKSVHAFESPGLDVFVYLISCEKEYGLVVYYSN